MWTVRQTAKIIAIAARAERCTREKRQGARKERKNNHDRLKTSHRQLD